MSIHDVHNADRSSRHHILGACGMSYVNARMEGMPKGKGRSFHGYSVLRTEFIMITVSLCTRENMICHTLKRTG